MQNESPGTNNSYLCTPEVPSEESWDQVAPAVSLVPIQLFSFGYLQWLPQWESKQSVYKHRFYYLTKHFPQIHAHVKIKNILLMHIFWEISTRKQYLKSYQDVKSNEIFQSTSST
jgi:hypothetical protein